MRAEQLFFEAIASRKIWVSLGVPLGTSLIAHFKQHINVYNLYIVIEYEKPDGGGQIVYSSPQI